MSRKRGHAGDVRVCVVNPNYYRSSGVTIAIRRIYTATKELGVEQYFVSCEYGAQTESTCWMPKGRTATFRLMDSNPIRVASELRELVHWLHSHEVNIIHVHHRRLAALMCLNKSLIGKVVYTGHAIYPFSTWFWPTHPSATTAISTAVAENMRHTMRIRDTRVVSNAVGFPPSLKHARCEEPVVDAVCVARLEPIKGQEYLIRAWAGLRDAGYFGKLALVGEGSMEERLRLLVQELDLQDLVDFRGFRSDVRSEFMRGRFGILVSETEGQGVVVLEAAACGRPSLVSNAGGLQDCLPSDRILPNGIPFGDVPKLIDALKAWFESPADVEEDGDHFFHHLQRTSSMETVGQQFADIYRNLDLPHRD